MKLISLTIKSVVVIRWTLVSRAFNINLKQRPISFLEILLIAQISVDKKFHMLINIFKLAIKDGGVGGGGVSLLWRHKKKRWCTKVTTESTNIKEKDKKEQEQNEWIKSRWTIPNARGWGKITLGGDKWMQTCNLRSGSTFVSLWKLHSGGQGETKSSSR